jgi:hypothetical protein
MTRLAGLVLAGLLMAAPSAAQPAPQAASWPNAAKWVGHYPNEKIDGVAQPFFYLPAIRAALGRLLEPADVTLFDSYHLPNRVRLISGYLVVNRCRLHDCPGANATLILDTASPGIWVAFDNRDPRAFTTRWVGSAGYATLPMPVQEAVTSG